MFSKLTDIEKCQIIIGNWLGDGTYDNRGGFLINRHTSKQNDYTLMLHHLYENMGILHSFDYDYPSPTNIDPNATSSKIIIKIPNKELFESFYDYSADTGYTKTGNRTYYKKGIKIITPLMCNNFIHPMGMLLWFLDDGSLSVQMRFDSTGMKIHGIQRYAVLCTHNFSYESHLLIQQLFRNINIDVNIYSSKSKNPVTQQLNGNINYYIYFNADNFRKFYDYVRPFLKYIPKNMHYKFNMKYEINSRKNSKFLTENYNCNV